MAALLTVSSGCAGSAVDPHDCAEPCITDEGLTDGDPTGGSGSTDGPHGDDGASGGSAAAAGLPCDVVDVLARNCAGCHGREPKFGAPMPLASHGDFQVPAITDPARPVYELMAERVTAEDAPMPPTQPLDDGDLGVLLDWIDAGAPLDPTADCEVDDGGDDELEDLPCDEPDLVMTAHGPGGADEPYHVPELGADNLYTCFAFKAPFEDQTQATAWAPIIDDERVVHHWILYRTKLPQLQEGPFPCDVTLQVTTEFVAGWAPGGGQLVLPDDVGLELGGPDDWYILQMHYNNTARHPDVRDRSGVAFCTAEEDRPNLAGIVTLGSLGIAIPPGAQDYDVTGACSGLATALWPELHVLGTSPHMHQLGRSMRSTVHRLDGTTEAITDVPAFDFESQGMSFHDPELIVHPGETITTTCTYDNPNPYPVFFGEGTNDEMCFDFVLAYPVDTLLDRNCGIVL